MAGPDKNGGRKIMGYVIPIFFGELFLVAHGTIALLATDHGNLKDVIQRLPKVEIQVREIDKNGGMALQLHLRDEERTDDKIAEIDKKIDRSTAKVDGLTESMTQVLINVQQLKTMLEEDRRNRSN